MENLKTAIYSFQDVDIVKQLVSRLARSEIESEDHHGLDILHHAILANYGEVVQYLLLRGYFTNQATSDKRPSYLHVGCMLGHIYIITLLLESRPYDYYSSVSVDSWLNWEAMEAVVQERVPQTVERSLLQSSVLIARAKLQNISSEDLLPLDIAAVLGHTNAVKLLLSSAHSKLDSKCLLEGAVKLNSPRTLNLLLTSEKHDQEALNEAVKAALRRKEAECLKLLLKHGANIVRVFHGLNPYHVMYMYSSAYTAPNTSNRNVGIDESTSVLLAYKQEVNVKLPLGSYPLYSLIHSLVYEKDQDPATVPTYHMKTLQLLLLHGATPNFDEVEYSESVMDNTLTIGRDLFTSGLNALFVSLQASNTWRALMGEQLDTCCVWLLEHGAQPNYMDSYGETPLHDLMKLWAMQHSMGHMHVDLTNMLTMLLKYGADPNMQSSNGLYPVHYYFKILFNIMGGLIAYQRWIKSNKPIKILRLLSLMRTDAALEAYQLIIQSCIEAKEDGMPDDIVPYLNQLVKDIVLEPKSLSSLCELEIWEAVGRRMGHVDRLPLPNRFIGDLKGLFDTEPTVD